MTSTKRPRIREAYTAMGLTRRMFAERVGLVPGAVSNIVNGAGMSEATAIRFAAVLGWNLDEVLRGEREPGHVSPHPLDPPRRDESDRPPNKPDSSSASAA